MTETQTRRINSERDALAYWEEEFGSPQYFFSFNELADVEMELANLQTEKDKLDREIQSRDVERMNEYSINRAIELHFLLEVGNKYFTKCIDHVSEEEESLENEFSRDLEDDNLFTRNYEED